MKRKKRFVLAYIPRRYEKGLIVAGPHILSEIKKIAKETAVHYAYSKPSVYELVQVEEL